MKNYCNFLAFYRRRRCYFFFVQGQIHSLDRMKIYKRLVAAKNAVLYVMNNCMLPQELCFWSIVA